MLINPAHWAFSLFWPVKLLTAEGILSFITQNTELFLKVKSMSTPSYSPKPPPPPIPIPPSPALSPHFHLYLFCSCGKRLSQATHHILSLFPGPDTKELWGIYLRQILCYDARNQPSVENHMANGSSVLEVRTSERPGGCACVFLFLFFSVYLPQASDWQVEDERMSALKRENG